LRAPASVDADGCKPIDMHATLLVIAVSGVRLNLPPLAEVATAGALPIAKVIKPTSTEDLYEWYVSNNKPDADPSWASVWPASGALANLIAREPALVAGRTVVELGCGLGVAGLAAKQAGASAVTLVDLEPLALHCALSTAECCGINEGVTAIAAGWSELSEQEFDVCLASECLYDPNGSTALANSVARLLKGSGGTLLLSDPASGRAVGCRAAMCQALKSAGAIEVCEEPLQGPVGVPTGAEALVLLRAEFATRT